MDTNLKIKADVMANFLARYIRLKSICVIGEILKEFLLKSLKKQECSLSLLLSNAFLERLAIMIRQSKAVKVQKLEIRR
jgi:hypothetical protein